MLKKHAKIIIPAALVIIILGLLLATPKILTVFYKEIVCPNTYFGDTDLSLENKESALAQMDAKINERVLAPIVFIYQNQTFEFLPQDVGITYDAEGTKADLPIIGDGNVINAVYNILTMKNIEPKYVLDKEKIINTLSILNTEIEETNAYLYLDETTQEVALQEETIGQTLNKEKLFADLEEKLNDMMPTTVDVETLAIEPTIKKADIEPFKEEAENILTREITVTYDDEEWIFSANENAQMLSFTAQNTISLPGFDFPIEINSNMSGSGIVETDMKIIIDQEKLEEYVTTNVSESVTILPQNVIIKTDEAQKTTFEGTAVDGVSVDTGTFGEMLAMAFLSDVSAITLPTKIEKGGVEIPAELQELGIEELISTGYTNYYGSPYNRTLNIAVGLSKFDGILVAPDEEFSFVTTLGTVDGSTGYYKELVITENETRPEYGGGLCQVSSTMYRAALYAGLPITARTEHSYAVSYYAYPSGYGIDATIYQPSPDLKFVNDTGAYILIQAYTEGTDAYIKFYGTNDGRTVVMDGPYYGKYISAPADVIVYTTELAPGEQQKKDSAHTGFDADWYRSIIFADGTQIEENIHSHYQAWPAKYLVGAEEGQLIEGESGSGTITE
ncbi:MAG: von Willebrand factor A [Candidatus Peregrinibacteria bacterium GW2011_GWF2_43_17]|nr:MAG: von Willebrand factor A [Candidatus Peregrinibacteria bacterium GW2011_GWF2_43_17]KKT19201.1 MAG: VanW family protein [Candidatus Peregrinibacteria bacterium GW2011_GWA2_43_8]HAU39609.1 hypothetical protein [Candidatus Peregrinibacteria bacterium]